MTRRRGSFFVTVVLGAVVSATIVLCPKPELYSEVTFSSAVEDRNGQLLRLSLAADDRYRLYTPLNHIDEKVIRATLLYEDRYFHSHPGVNPIALTRAAWSTYVRKNRVIGGSTITMQLARLRYSLQTRTVRGKLLQMARAIQLERHYSKDEILEAYLNLAPYGGNIEGIAAAALIYFDKTADHLSLAEATAMVVIPQNPTGRAPATASGYEQMIDARGRLIDLWDETAAISDETRQLLQLPLAIRSAAAMPYNAPHFSRSFLARAGDEPGIHTSTLDLSLQGMLEQQIAHFVERHEAVGIHNASAMLVDYRSMEVLAAVGSADFYNSEIAGQVDGTLAKRSPGSTLKPFVYGLAMDRGLIHPMSMLKDAPKRFGAYTPENFDRGFMGPVFAKDALVYSRNVPAIGLLSDVGHETFHGFLTDGEVAGLKNPEFYGLAMILGGNELTMVELTRLYAMLANDGKFRSLTYRRTAQAPADDRVMLSPEASFLVLDMLRQNPRPDRLAMQTDQARVPIAWKTGTSYAYRDAWSIGVLGPYVLSVWVGNFDGSGNPAFVGRTAAAPLFFAMADVLTASLPDDAYQVNPPADLNLRQVAICASTGDLPGQHCPGTTQSWFIPGVSPIRVSSVHRAVRVDNRTGKRTCDAGTEYSHEEVYAFWPSDLAQLYQKAGISFRRPPPWDERCALDGKSARGIRPEITSPAPLLGYHLRPDRLDEEILPLTATTDADVKSLFWFVNDAFLARVDRDEALLWRPQTGEFEILVVDDLGRSHSNRLTVTVAQ